MKFTETGRTSSDETTPYSVTEYESTTVREFIEEVLKEKPNEWGYIQVYQREQGWIMSPHVCEYLHGEIVKSEHPELLDLEIHHIDARGGWSYMCYMIYVE